MAKQLSFARAYETTYQRQLETRILINGHMTKGGDNSHMQPKIDSETDLKTLTKKHK